MKLFANPDAILMFLAYLGSGIVMLAAYMQAYMWMTPYDDLKNIREGETPWTTIAFASSMVGFTMPLFSSSLYGATLLDFVAWGVIAAVAQLLTYQLIKFKLGGKTTETMNGSIIYSAAMLCVGAINAVSLVP